ncbi:MAG TPA: F0F1 ATP synthase subunit B [Solirubrobacteraceae bacterium]|nr:F0F1 ATP synthase subunit B [Solirubrobacteraceae bacterium]
MADVLPTTLASSGNFLVKPGIGLMIWTLIVFGATMILLWRLAFPRITEALDRRQKEIEDSIDSAQKTREDAEQLLAEYRQRLADARSQSDEIVQRARQTAEAHERESKDHARELAAEASTRAARDIEAATQRAMQELRQEVADLTVMATEKVTRKVLDDADQRRLVDEALGELDFSGISSGGGEG